MKREFVKLIIIPILVIMLVITDFIMLGHEIAIAMYEELEAQNSTTSVKNVEFDAYFLENGNKTHKKESQVPAEETLILAIKVKEKGELSDAKIKIENANFEIQKDKVKNNAVKNINLETNEIELNQIIYNNNVEIELPIRLKTQNTFSEDYFEKENTISISGTYKDTNEKRVDGSIKTRVIYRGQADTNVTQSFDKYLNLGESGILLEQNITTQVVENSLPKQNETVTIEQVPILDEKEPKEIVVLVNGNKMSSDKVNYNHEDKSLQITNASQGTWTESSNRYQIIYYYEANVEFSTRTVVSHTKVNTKLYSQENIEKEPETQEFEITPKGNAVSIQKTAAEKLYKGYLYANVGKETIFEESNRIGISDIKSVESIELGKQEEVFLNENQAKFEIANQILYQETKVNKSKMQAILGNEGTITITDGNNETLAIMNQETQADENGNIVIRYEKEVTNLKVQTTKPVSQGEIVISHTRAIKSDTGYQKEQLKAFVAFSTASVVTSNLSQEVSAASIKLEDTKTEAKIEMNHANLSTLQTNENVQLIATLKSNSEQYDLYKNPVVDITFPPELQVKINQITQLNAQEEVKITNIQEGKSSQGGKIIRLILQGEQKTFGNAVNEGIQISMSVNIDIDKATPTKQSEITMSYTNENRPGETFVATTPVHLNSKHGILIVNKLSEYNESQDVLENTDDKISTGVLDTKSESREAKQEIAIINNYDRAITDVTIIGKIPEIGEEAIGNSMLKSTFETKLKEALKVEGRKAKIYYSEDEKIEKESDKWSESTKDVTKIRAFKIILEDNKLMNSEIIKLSYYLQIPENLDNNQSTYTNLTLFYNYAGDMANTSSTMALKTKQQDVALVSEQTQNMSIQIVGKSGGEFIRPGQEVYEGQAIKYIVKITNNSKEDINNIVINATQTNSIFYTEKDYHDGWDSTTNTEGVEFKRIEENPNLTEMIMKIDTLKPGETIERYYQFSVKEVEKDATTTGRIQIMADEQETKSYNTLTNPIVQAELKLQMRNNYEVGDTLRTGGDYPFLFDITNISGETKENIILKFEVPEGFVFDSMYLWEAENNEYQFVSYENRILVIKVLKIDALETMSIRLSLDVEQMDTSIQSKVYNFLYTATLGNSRYVSNEQTQVVNNMKSDISAMQKGSIEGKTVKNGDKLEYIIEIENKGPLIKDIEINDDIPSAAVISKATMQILENGIEISKDEQEEFIENSVSFIDTLQVGQKCIIKIETTIDVENAFEKELTNEVKIIDPFQDITCNSVTYYIEEMEEKPEEPEEPENPDIPDNPSDPDSEITHNIQGVAWIDSNKNGLKEISEEVLEGIEVVLVEEKTGEIVKDKDGNKIKTKTDKDGSYKFIDIKQGRYFVIFQYDNTIYRVTQYQAQGVSEKTNSDVISKKIRIEGKEQIVAITKSLSVTEDLIDIDAGFIRNEKFDLNLRKVIDKVIIQDNKGTTVKQYSGTNLAKVEIDAKQLANSIVIVEYRIQVTNEGELPGYVNEIVDYKPKDLSFSSEMNKNWYTATDGQLYSKELENQVINVGETKSVTLTLIKNMNQNNTGTTINTAEINKVSNNFSVLDIDSIPSNKVSGEDDMDTAELIVSIRTGGIMKYIALISVIVSIIGIGVYLIKKNVLIEKREFMK